MKGRAALSLASENDALTSGESLKPKTTKAQCRSPVQLDASLRRLIFDARFVCFENVGVHPRNCFTWLSHVCGLFIFEVSSNPSCVGIKAWDFCLGQYAAASVQLHEWNTLEYLCWSLVGIYRRGISFPKANLIRMTSCLPGYCTVHWTHNLGCLLANHKLSTAPWQLMMLVPCTDPTRHL